MKDKLHSVLLPLSLALGIAIYLVLHYAPGLDDSAYLSVARFIQPIVVGLMLFIQLNVLSPSEMKFHLWHWWLLGVQALLFGLLVVAAILIPPGTARILVECGILCIICPTAAAASVMTARIGGSLPSVVTYLVLSDAMACVLIPLMIPIVHPAEGITFFSALWAVAKKVFSILALPCLLAWFIRYHLPSVQRWIARYVDAAFYVWCFSLTLAMSLATSALVDSRIGVLGALGIALVSLLCCVGQYLFGRLAVKRRGPVQAITAGQAMGQKNTGFIIWCAYNFMTPVTSVAGGLYAIWQNLINSWELSRFSRNNV